MDDFDRDIRNAFHARQLPGAPNALLETLTALPPRPARPAYGTLRLVLGIAATLVVLVVAVVALGGGSPTVPPAGSSTPSVAAVVSPSLAPSVSVAPSSEPTPSAEPTPSVQPSPPVKTPTPATNVGFAGLIDATHGWAVADQRLVVTADGGSSWRDVNPPAPTEGTTPANLLSVEFLDPDHGWVAVAEPFKTASDPGFGRVDIWRTTDGGQNWAKATLPPAVLHNQGDTLGDVEFDFLDPTHGLALITGGAANAAHDSDLYWTADGGRTWSADRPTGSGSDGVEGSVAFTTTNDGVVAGGPIGSGLSFTRDGGKTWQSASLSAPAGMAGALRFVGRPVFFDARTGLLPVLFEADSGNVTRVYRTTDAGATWGFVSHVPGTGSPEVSIVDQQHWIALDGPEVVRTANAGATWTRAASQPPAPSLQGAQFLDPATGWAVWTDKLGNSRLYATSDGGVSWHPLSP